MPEGRRRSLPLVTAAGQAGWLAAVPKLATAERDRAGESVQQAEAKLERLNRVISRDRSCRQLACRSGPIGGQLPSDPQSDRQRHRRHE